MQGGAELKQVAPKLLKGAIEKCICGTNKPFLKPVADVQNKVETRSILQKKKRYV